MIPTSYHISKGDATTKMRICVKKLSCAMIRKGIRSAKELSEKSGLSVNTLSRIKNGGRAALQTVQRLAEALEVTPEDIIADE